MKNPCDPKCPRRAVGCHSTCEDHLAWREEQNTMKKAEAEAKKTETDFAGYAMLSHQKLQKRRRKR